MTHQPADNFFRCMSENCPDLFWGLYYNTPRWWDEISRCRTVLERKSDRSPAIDYRARISDIWYESLDCISGADHQSNLHYKRLIISRSITGIQFYAFEVFRIHWASLQARIPFQNLLERSQSCLKDSEIELETNPDRSKGYSEQYNWIDCASEI